MGLNWAKSEAFSDGLLRAIISKRLKSLSDWRLMLNLAQMYPKLIPVVTQESKRVFLEFLRWCLQTEPKFSFLVFRNCKEFLVEFSD